MNLAIFRNILIVLFVAFGITEIAAAEIPIPCSKYQLKIPHQNLKANAGFFDNMRNREGSVRFESYALFIDASKKYQTIEKPKNLCPGHCALPDKPHFLFSSVPNRHKNSYSDREKCEKYLEETTRDPLKYTKKLPRGIDPTSDWISEFSQGDGKEGKDLYRKCDGKCSPQYHYNIHLENDLLITNAEVICGHARDKDDNLYQLSSYFVWECEDK